MRRLCLQPLLQISTTHHSGFSISYPTTTNDRISCFSAECNRGSSMSRRRRGGSLPQHQFRHVSFRCCSPMSSDGPELNSKPSVVAHKPSISFCQFCGGPTKHIVPDGEERMRAVCTLCGKIHYENPKMVVGCLVEHNGKVLLCKRKIQPSYGFWTLPAGFLEIGESALEGAARETLEEACAEVEGLSPFAQIDIPRIGQVYLIFRAKLKKPHFSPGPESLECQLFSLEDIPFDSLAFSSIIVTLRLYVEDIKAGNLKFHYCTINKRPGASITDPNGFDVDYLLPS